MTTKKKKSYLKSRTFYLKRIDFRADVNEAPDCISFTASFLSFVFYFIKKTSLLQNKREVFWSDETSFDVLFFSRNGNTTFLLFQQVGRLI